MTMTNWINSTYRKLHLDFHQPAWMSGVSSAVTEEEAAKQARMFRQAGVEAVGIFVYDHYGQAFFQSDIGVVHPGLQREYPDIMSRALKEQGLKVILYLNALSSVHLFKSHSDWFLKTEEGLHPKACWLQHDASHICVSSPYIEQYFVPLLQESITRFGPDAVWIDTGSWMIEFPCYCDYCIRAYRDDMGRELPAGPMPGPREELENEEWLTWRLWRRGQIAPYLTKVIAGIKQVDNNILVAENNSGKYSYGVPRIENGRLMKWLTPKELGVDWLSCDPVPNGGNHELILSREGRYQATTGLPFDYMNERFHGWGQWQYRSQLDWKLEMATMMAVGARCFFADQPYPDGTVEPTVYRDLKDVYDFVRLREPFVLDAKPVPDIAVLASLATNLLGPGGGAEWGRPPECWFDMDRSRTVRIHGAHLSLVELGVQHWIYDEATLRNQLNQQSAVIIADQCLMEEETLQSLERYVSEGGLLLITGRSGLWNEGGKVRKKDPFERLLGLRRTGSHEAPIHYLKACETLLADSDLDDVLLQVWGSASKVELRGAKILAKMVAPREDVWRSKAKREQDWQHYTVVGAAPPGEIVVGPAITIHEFGSGKALYINVDLFSLYYQEGHRYLRDWIQKCLDLLIPPVNRKFVCSKPLHVEMSMMHQERGSAHRERYLIHAVNFFAQKRPGMLVHNEQLAPVANIEIRVRVQRRPAAVLLQPERTPISFEWDEDPGQVTIVIPKLYIHTIVSIEFEQVLQTSRCSGYVS